MPHGILDDARRDLGLSYVDLWIGYFALGGNLDVGQLAQYLHGERTVTDSDHNLIVHTLNEQFLDRGQDHPLEYRPG